MITGAAVPVSKAAAVIAITGAMLGLGILVLLSVALSVFAVYLSLETRRQIEGRAKAVAAEAVAITVNHGGVPPVADA